MMKSAVSFEFEMPVLQKQNSTNFLVSTSSVENLNDYSIPFENSDFYSSDLCCKSYNSDDEEALSHISEPNQENDTYDLIIQEPPHLGPDDQEKPLINMEISRKMLKINGKTPRGDRLDFSGLNGVKKLQVDFTNFLFTEGQIRRFALTLENLEKVKKVKLIIRNQKEGLIIQKLLGEIFSKLQGGLKSVKFDFYRSGVASDCVAYLSEKIIPELKGLKSFHINLYDSDITNENIQKLAWSLKENFQKLEDFRCTLGQTKVTEKVIVQLFHEMPKMQKFELNIGNCVFTDYGMKIFIRNTLKSMNVLKSFTFLLEATDFMSAQLM